MHAETVMPKQKQLPPQATFRLVVALLILLVFLLWERKSNLDLRLAFSLGLLLGCLQAHPVRSIGLVPWAVTGMAATALWGESASPSAWAVRLFCVCWGVVWCPPLLAVLRPPALVRRPLLPVYVGTIGLVTLTALVGLLSGLADPGLLLTACAVVAWIMLIRQALEEAAELPFHLMYRVRVLGDGPGPFPRRGPAVVIANHSAFCDPVWIGKVVPRLVTPMMTKKYYDRPIMYFLMKYIVDPLRVANAERRKEAPELKEAVARLDRGECLVMFPEGKLRRREDLILQHFGQGLWHILRDRPGTPVVACWIHGGWGSFFSYKHGPPGSGKPFDIRRRITIVMGAPFRVPAEVLETQQATRRYLMDQVLAQRALLPAELRATESEVTAERAKAAEAQSAAQSAEAEEEKQPSA
jgi:1-acyl-sn-glycerol-3-phosphate acyltransferase